MDTLRLQCPWDRKQTLESLRYMTIEEVFELTEAILERDPQEIKKELGDVWLHIVFYSKLADEQGWFDIADVAEALVEKLKRRHPHIYGHVEANTEADVKANWENLKLQEGNKSVFSGIPVSLPPLVKAQRLQEKAKGCGFEWETTKEVAAKVQEEVNEFLEVARERPYDTEALEGEMGDLIFSLINLSRYLNINPLNALDKTNQKFMRRFNFIEETARERGQNMQDMGLTEMDALWEEAKRMELHFNKPAK